MALAAFALLCIEYEGFAVCALTCCGVALVSTHCDLVKGTEVAGMSVVRTLSYSASDSMIGLLDLFHINTIRFVIETFSIPKLLWPRSVFLFVQNKKRHTKVYRNFLI